MTASIGDLYMRQQDGGLPKTMAEGSAPGEHGVSILSLRFRDGAHLSGMPGQHLIALQLSGKARFNCRIGTRTLRHEPAAGAIAICPAGVDFTAECDGGLDSLLVAVHPGYLKLAAAEEFSRDSYDLQMVERLTGRDPTLHLIARTMVVEAVERYPNGPLFWNDLANSFIARVMAQHTSASRGRQVHGLLGKDMLARLRDYVMAHLDGPIDVAALADLAGRSPFHFSRVFTRSVGMTPHRYLVHLRLRRAVELLGDGRSGLAEIAARTGFADQSHLSRWVRRVYGVSPSEFVH